MNLRSSYVGPMPTAIQPCETLDDLTRLAMLADRHGLDRLLPGLLDRVVARARLAGVAPVLIEILTDPDAPEVARQRALGRIHRQLAGHGHPTPALGA